MSYFGTSSYETELALGNITGRRALQKFGKTDNADNGVLTDVWDGSKAALVGTGSLIWVAPTQARVHTIASTDTNDDGPSGTGARSLTIYGLTDWDTTETSEVVVMDGAGANAAQTANSYVIIYRMEVTSFGASGPNVGTITATANTDSTVTAFVEIAQGQTQMAIYGVPSVETLLIDSIYHSMLKGAGGSANATTALWVATDPENFPGVFIKKFMDGVSSGGSSNDNHEFPAKKKIAGPAIVKLQVESNTINTPILAGFDGEVITN